MKKICFIFVFLFSFQIFAAEFNDDSLIRIETRKTERRFWVLNSENGITKIDIIEEKNNEAQQLIKSWGFSDYEKAIEFYNRETKSFPEFTADQWQAETDPVTSLKALKLWEPTNTWNWDWELKYADWISKNVDKTFMQKYQIPSDCADLAYLLRWIFARDHSLPMATRLSATGKYMTHETVLKEWEKLSTDPEWFKDKRFRAALKYVSGQTYTHTLIDDSYPVALNSEAFTEGIHHLHLRDHSGHTMLVHRVDKSGGVPIQVLYSNMPIEIRELYEAPFTDSSWPQDGTVGFLRFRWPQKTNSGWSLVSKSKMPFYSLEQFSEDLKKEGESFFIVAFKRVSPNFDPKRLVLETIDSIFAQFANRVKVIEDGFAFCQTNSCEPGTDGDENWSTPSRDRRLRETLMALDLTYSMYKKIVPSETMAAEFKNKFDLFRITTNGKTMGFNHAFMAMNFELASSDPRVPIAERWALDMPAAVTSTEKILTSQFTRRDKKIQQAKRCTPTTCPWGSAEWTAASTSEIDLQIGDTISRITQFCYVLTEECDQLNKAIAESSNFQKLVSRAVTQQTTPYVSIEKRRGTELKKVSVVPGDDELFKLGAHHYFQSRKLFEQRPDQYFPRIICPVAQISISLFTTCLDTVDSVTKLRFFDPQVRLLKTVPIDIGTINMITSYGWVDQADLFYIVQIQKVSIYAKDGSLVSVIEKPNYAQIKADRWLYKLDDKHYALDMKYPQKGWIAQDVPANEVGPVFQAHPLKFSEDRILFYNAEKLILTNENGQRVLEMNERVLHVINDNEYLVTSIKETADKFLKIYKYESGTYKLFWQVPLQTDTKMEKISFMSVDSGLFMFYELRWTYVDLKTKTIEPLPWIDNKVVAAITPDYVITFFSETDMRQTLWTRSGEKIFDSNFMQIQKDVLNDRYSLGVMDGNVFVSHIFKDQNSFYDPFFSNAGFSYGMPTEMVQKPGLSPTYFFYQKGIYKEMKFLFWLGVSTSSQFAMNVTD